ncbi:MAG TPA: dUTP diphosphatase [Candidatus Saccharimonadales bacterium]|nr:dUTP diphosphatase [Candidatus Saccharimonadales bacterium]
MKVHIVNNSSHPLPQYHSDQAACVDLTANLREPITLKSLERAMVPTGIYIALPEGYEAQIRPRSGLAAKHGISVLNTPGTIDADYRGELMVILVNLSQDEYTINDGERIAQMLIAAYEPIQWQEVDTLDATVRGEGAFGHTGK